VNRAIVFLRRHAAHGIGHVGWAFADGADTFNAGAVENPRGTLHTPPAEMGFWTLRTRDPAEPMRARRYDEFKVIDVEQADPTFARRVVAWVRQQPYDVVGCNCMDVTYDVLRAYGVPHLPVPAHHWEPNHWFDHVPGSHYYIDGDGVRQEADRRQPAMIGTPKPDLDSPIVDQPPEETPSVPAWRTPDTEEARIFQAAMLAAPLMPQASAHHNWLAIQTFLANLLRLLGIEHR
jgi:hypothetical protein